MALLFLLQLLPPVAAPQRLAHVSVRDLHSDGIAREITRGEGFEEILSEGCSRALTMVPMEICMTEPGMTLTKRPAWAHILALCLYACVANVSARLLVSTAVYSRRSVIGCVGSYRREP